MLSSFIASNQTLFYKLKNNPIYLCIILSNVLLYLFIKHIENKYINADKVANIKLNKDKKQTISNLTFLLLMIVVTIIIYKIFFTKGQSFFKSHEFKSSLFIIIYISSIYTKNITDYIVDNVEDNSLIKSGYFYFGINMLLIILAYFILNRFDSTYVSIISIIIIINIIMIFI
jgi:hypothetical protein